MDFDVLIEKLRDGMNRDVTDFFLAVSRLDYGLKKAGTFFQNPAGPSPNIDWRKKVPDAFAGFDAECSHMKDREFFKEPPQDFKIVNGKAEFTGKEPALTDTASIFDAIRRLRNNLMHGTKGKLFVRDQTLCADALEVVKLAYEFCQKSADPTLQAVARKMADF